MTLTCASRTKLLFMVSSTVTRTRPDSASSWTSSESGLIKSKPDAYRFAAEYGVYKEDWEKTNSLEDIVYVPHGLTEDMIRDYVNRCYDACYARLHQYFTLPRRIHTFEHLRFLVRYFLKQTRLVN